MSDRSAGYQLLEGLVGLELKLEESARSDVMDTVHMKIRLREDPDILESAAFSVIFAVGVLSFADARPRGHSELGGFVEEDEWTVADMLRHLRFENGALRFYADYVRGRMMKTTVEIRADGTIQLDTINRGEAANRWVSVLQRKKHLHVPDLAAP